MASRERMPGGWEVINLVTKVAEGSGHQIAGWGGAGMCCFFIFIFFSDSRLKQGVGLVEDVICSGRGSLQFKRAI